MLMFNAVIFLGLTLLVSKTKRGSGGPSPEKFFILRWLKPHFLILSVQRVDDKKSENGKNITLTL